MRLVLHGGFGEKGRTSIAVECDGYRLLLDAGVKTSARGHDDYYPAISQATLKAADAIVITHGHEDHVAALGWYIARGFNGRLFMTAETRREADLCLASYATQEHRELVRQANVEHLPVGDGTFVLGPLTIFTGRSGHIAGGVWCRVNDGRTTFHYCGDVVPESPVFAMDPILPCTAIALDASYGDDDVCSRDRVVQIREWITSRPMGCVLPTPLYGRSAELLGIIPGGVALAPGMRDALRTQIAASNWLKADTVDALAARVDSAGEWRDGMTLPRAALLCHDGMGISGPSRSILESALVADHPTLFTGHLPTHSPGERMVAEGRATWIRLPTHPTLTENLAMVATSAASTILGHSCDRPQLTRLAEYVPSLRTDLATGDYVDL
ncbi:MAG: MBL fold metallo-hydrolase [Betaproteobacteria bacterium]|nr:MBL fold metallo-hydrolase [Betaproteobacteria bacterium]MBA3777159.1 MBL fold metallo-hydrolase [Betaproteobacteria bacterium]